MPVTFTLVPHAANSITLAESTAQRELYSASPAEYHDSYKKLWSSSFGPGNPPVQAPSDRQLGKNGIADAFLTAYNTHHALVLRPDDIWLAIAVQFSFYVNKYAEELRGRFVAHEGQEKINISFNPYDMMNDGGALAKVFATELGKRVTDTKLKSWIIPDFSTTTETDRVVGCAVFMGAMKKYFTFSGGFCCGIPRVTLEGTRSDWEEILTRADRLQEYGNECVPWHQLLMPVLRGFIATFDDPTLEKATTREFWDSSVQYGSRMSGVTNIAGWISAFYPFDTEGNSIRKSNDRGVSIEGIRYPVIEIESIPACYATVDVKLYDDLISWNARMLAGVVGSTVSSSGDTSLSETGLNDTVSPHVAWWLFDTKWGKTR
ncbi:hypothetical protein BKA62DRAFT_766539 [Auriculariales sp. MPI-PUGE-AT-0066]|nr:hypothetical protein BKA62DRAFT_766539 [Auriculariales sp. MPI-PUGE-AT-0066]